MVLSRSFRFGLSVIKLVRHQYILAEEQQASSAQEKSVKRKVAPLSILTLLPTQE